MVVTSSQPGLVQRLQSALQRKQDTQCTYSESVCLALAIHHVTRMRRVILSSVECRTLRHFFPIILQTARLSKKLTEDKTGVLIFSAIFV